MNNLNIIKQYDYLVKKIALQYNFHPSVDLRDLEQEAYIGLLTADQRYDPEMRVSFDSFAIYWMRYYITQFLKQMGIKVDCRSLNEQDLNTHPDGTDKCCPDDTEDKAHAEQIDALYKALDTLSDRDRFIICSIYGIKTERLSEIQIAQIVHLRADTVSHIHHDCLKKLKKWLKNAEF